MRTLEAYRAHGIFDPAWLQIPMVRTSDQRWHHENSACIRNSNLEKRHLTERMEICACWRAALPREQYELIEECETLLYTEDTLEDAARLRVIALYDPLCSLARDSLDRRIRTWEANVEDRLAQALQKRMRRHLPPGIRRQIREDAGEAIFHLPHHQMMQLLARLSAEEVAPLFALWQTDHRGSFLARGSRAVLEKVTERTRHLHRGAQAAVLEDDDDEILEVALALHDTSNPELTELARCIEVARRTR